MLFNLTKEQEMIRRMVRDFTDAEIIPNAPQWDRDAEWPVETVKKMYDIGLLTFAVPTEYGGQDLDWVSKHIVIDELCRGDLGLGSAIQATALLAADPVWLGGNEEQKKWWYGRTMEGGMGAFALTEPSAGSDALGMFVKCTRDGNDWVINGAKQFITNAKYAENLLVWATEDRSLGMKGINGFMVDAKSPGISFDKKEDKMGCRSGWTGSVVFDNVRVPGWMRLGTDGTGGALLMQALDLSRTSVACEATGVATAALEAAISYANERRQFGKPIAAFQAVQFMLADMSTQLEAAKLLWHKASWLQDNNLPYKIVSSEAKLFASDTAMEICSNAIQIHGGYGYTKEYPVEKYFRDIKITQIWEGTNQIQRMVIGKELSKAGNWQFYFDVD